MKCFGISILIWIVAITSCHKRMTKGTEQYIDSVNIKEGFSKEEKVIYWENFAKSNQLQREYQKKMSLIDDEGKVTREVVNEFKALFTPEAMIWNDIHPEPHPISPIDYVVFVKRFMHNGVSSSQRTYGDYNRDKDKRLMRYYKVGDGKNEYYLHVAVEKRIFYGLNKNMEVVGLGKEGKVFLLEFITYINNETNEYKIAGIKPLLK